MLRVLVIVIMSILSNTSMVKGYTIHTYIHTLFKVSKNKLGPWLFLTMIDEFAITNASLWKFVDDTTASEVVKKGHPSGAQNTTNQVIGWSKKNRLILNTDKCKELRIGFPSVQRDFDPVSTDGKHMKLVKQAIVSL